MKRKIGVVLLAAMILLSGCKAQWEKIGTWQEGYDLGIRYLSEGKYEEAILAFGAAIEIEPMRADAFAGRAEVYLMLSQQAAEGAPNYRQLAMKDLQQALELGASGISIYRTLAQLYLDLGDAHGAIETYAKAADDGAAEEQDRKALLMLAKDAYKKTVDEIYLQYARKAWDPDALQAFGAFLGADETMAFAAEDLNWDGVPELISGPIYKNGPEGVTATSSYSVYVYRGGAIEPIAENIYMVPADGWTGPIEITPERMLISNSHSRLIGAGWYYISWDGTHGGETYLSTQPSFVDGALHTLYYIDEEAVTGEEFSAFTAEHAADAVDLIMYPNTPENRMKYLGIDMAEEMELLEQIRPIVEILHDCGQANHCAKWDISNAYSRTFVNGSLTGRLYRGSIELMEGEEYDPIGISYFPVTNFQTMEELKQYLAGFISEELFGTDVLDFDGLEEIEGKLYAYRGGRGYGAYGYDTETLRILHFDETTCVAQCQKMLFDVKDAMMQLTFEKQDGRWILAGLEQAQ